MAMAACVSTTFGESARKRLKIFILASESNMGGLCDVRTLQSLSIEPFRPTLEQVRPAENAGTADQTGSAGTAPGTRHQ